MVALQSLPDNEYLMYLVFTILKLSAISTKSNDALIVSQSLYKDAFEHADKTKQTQRVKNFFLTQLGLLKIEDKSFKPKYNLNNCRKAIQYAMAQNSFSADVKDTFELFLKNIN